MLRDAQAPWSVRTHELWPDSFRRSVRTVLLVGVRLQLPSDALTEHVLPFLNRDDLVPHFCMVCGAGASTLNNRCAGCSLVWYCGEEHMLEAWRGGHKPGCKRAQRVAKAKAKAERKRKKKAEERRRKKAEAKKNEKKNEK